MLDASRLLEVGFLKESIDDRPCISAQSKEGSFTILCDTGSPCNVIDIRTKKEYFSDSKITYSDVILHGLGNSELEIVGECMGEFIIDKFQFKEKIIVVRGLDIFPIMILGHHTMEKKFIKVSPPDHGVFIRNKYIRYNHTLHLQQQPSGQYDSFSSVDIINAVSQNHVDKIYLQEDLNIPPHSHLTIKASIKSGTLGKEVLVLPETCQIGGLSVTNAI